MARAADPARARRAATWIVRTLRDAGHVAYFAGGCVRDGLLGLHPTDFDVATDAPPPRVRGLFPRTAEVGAAFGVVLVHVPAQHTLDPDERPAPGSSGGGGGVTVEVATFRADGPYTDARRPDSVRFSDPLADAQRRDFTINALFLDPLAPPDPPDPAVSLPSAHPDLQGRVIDLVGGVADLRARVVRAVGDPDGRLAEDHLRALRAVRFAARLGFTLDPATAAAITRHAAQLRGVSRERIGDELRRMLAHPARAAALTLLQDLALDAPALNEPPAPAPPPAHRPPLRLTAALPPDADVPTALAAWATDRANPALGKHPTLSPKWLSDADTAALIRRWRPALCLSNDETDALTATLDAVRAAVGFDALTVPARKRAASKSRFGQGLAIVRGWSPAVADHVQGEVACLAADGVGLAPAPLVTGDDLVAAGWTPGPRFKGVLERVYDAQLEGRVREKADALELARALHV
jgi:poly(A) polymerase